MRNIKKIFTFNLLIFFISYSNNYCGEKGLIHDATLLPNVKHKIVVLEYDNPLNTTWGKDISQIISQEILGTMTGVQSVGVVNLYQSEDKVVYTPNEIKEIGDRQKALIVIWGEFYIENDNVYLHSHLRIIPSKDFPESGLGLRAEMGDLKALPPTLQVNFKPIKLKTQALEKLHSFYNQTNIIRKKPDDQSQEIGKINLRDAYTINSRNGDWSKITLSSGISGWIKHSTLSRQEELIEIKNSLKLPQGILQYISGSYNTAINSLENYISLSGFHQEKMNLAFSHILLGTAILRSILSQHRSISIEVKNKVIGEYEIANSILKNNSSAINYITVVKCVLGEFDRSLEQKLINIIRTYNDVDAIHNLKNIYQDALYGGDFWEKNHDHTLPIGPSDKFRKKIEDRIKILDEINMKISKQ